MKIRQKTPIGMQISFLPVLAVTGFFVVLLVQYLGHSLQIGFNQSYARQLDLINTLRQVQQQMIVVRVSEKKFFADQSTDNLIKYESAIRSISTNLSEIKSNTKLSANVAKIDEWTAVLRNYQAYFHTVANALQFVGYSEDIGLRGSMRRAIHLVEQRISDNDPVLMRDMLELRRHEKDYIIRQNEEYYVKWESALTQFRTSLKTTDLTDTDRVVIKFSLRQYISSFRMLTKQDLQITKNKIIVDRISNDLQKRIGLAFIRASGQARMSLKSGIGSSQSTFYATVILTFITGIMVFLVSRWIGSGIRTPLASLASAMVRLAKGDLNIRVTASDYGNEIGEMANSVRVFRENEKSRRLANIQLSMANKQTRNIIQSMNEALFEVDVDGRIKTTNRAAERLLGLPPNGLIARKLKDFFVSAHTVDAQQTSDNLKLSLIGANLENQREVSTASVVAFIQSAPVPVFLASGDGVLVGGNAKLLEALGYDAQDIVGLNINDVIPKFFRAGNKKPVADFSNDSRGGVINNGKALSARSKDGSIQKMVVGYTPLTLHGKPYFLCICRRKGIDSTLHEMRHTVFGQLFKGFDIGPKLSPLVLTSDQPEPFEDIVVGAGGAKIPVSCSVAVLRDEHKAVTGALCVVRDISQSRQADRKILQLKKSLDQSSDEIYMFWPKSYRIFYQNRAACQLTGWGEDVYVSKSLSDFHANFDAKLFTDQVESLINGEVNQLVYERMEPRTNKPVEVFIQYIAPEQDGTRPYFVSSVRDITDRKAAEKAKAEFLSTVSHELRTPLTSIKGALGIINSGAVGKLNDKIASLVSIALKNSDRLNRLINDILDIEKIGSGKMSFYLEPMDLSELIKESIEANNSYAKMLGVQFRIQGTSEPVMVNGDKDRLMQVMANLLSNAAKFSDKGQTIDVSLTKQDRQVRVAVTDSGCGIPKDSHATIFDKFTQADSSDQREKGGTGLGLSIVKEMVAAHGGQIAFDSVKGKGTTFYFDLDLLEQASFGDQENRPQDQKNPKKPAKMLICEDEPDIAKILTVMLNGAGYETDIAPTAALAKSMLKANAYDGMTLDLNLPDQNGLDLLRELRARPEFQDLPIFVISASMPDGNSKEIGLGFGVTDWLHKPIDENRLLRVLEQKIAGSSSNIPSILHVEDNQHILDIVKAIIGKKAIVVTATSVAQARQKLESSPFDLVILDLDLPDGCGADVLGYLNQPERQSPPVLIFSANEAPDDLIGGVEAALVKAHTSHDQFLQMVEATLNRASAELTAIAAE